MLPGPIVLRMSSGGMRWRLAERDASERCGTVLLGSLTARPVVLLVGHQLSTAALARWFQATPAAALFFRRPPAVAPAKPFDGLSGVLASLVGGAQGQRFEQCMQLRGYTKRGYTKRGY